MLKTILLFLLLSLALSQNWTGSWQLSQTNPTSFIGSACCEPSGPINITQNGTLVQMQINLTNCGGNPSPALFSNNTNGPTFSSGADTGSGIIATYWLHNQSIAVFYQQYPGCSWTVTTNSSVNTSSFEGNWGGNWAATGSVNFNTTGNDSACCVPSNITIVEPGYNQIVVVAGLPNNTLCPLDRLVWVAFESVTGGGFADLGNGLVAGMFANQSAYYLTGNCLYYLSPGLSGGSGALVVSSLIVGLICMLL